jgi:hypothetical protein
VTGDPPFNFPAYGELAALPSDDGSKLLLVDKLDEAGAPYLFADDPSSVRSLVGTTNHVYWTNAAGELRRRPKDAGTVSVLIHGLSDDTEIAANDTLIIIVDRRQKRVLSYAP